MSEFSTPLMRQYSAIKQRHPNALLLFRLGDFYELFFEDAVVASKELQITLTSRNKEKGVAIPMCGVPYHAAEGYIAKLIRRGYRVAICDQMEEPRFAKKLVKREVTRVVTPGTAIDSQILEPRENNYLAAVAERDGNAGLAFVDLSTGDFRATEFSGPEASARLQEELDRMRPSELLVASRPTSPADSRPDPLAPITQTPLDDWVFAEEYGARLLRDHFRVATLAGYGLESHGLAVAAAGAVLHYVRETQRGSLSHLDGLRFYQQQDSLILDPATLRNLELLEPAFGESRAATLLGILDECVTSLGARKLKAWMLRPSLDRSELEARLDVVEEFLKSTIEREEFRRAMGGVQDLERLLSKVTLETAHARDLLALKQSFQALPLLRTYLNYFQAARLKALRERLDELGDVRELLEKAIDPEPPVLLNEGGLIRPGYDAQLDELRELSQNSKRLLALIEVRERERTRISSLKVRFNSIFGYYIEVSKANLHLAPVDYERKQTLVNAERFTTPELKELEAKILDAEERSQTLERDLFLGVRRQVAKEAHRIRQTAAVLAELDVLACFAHLAAERHYRRPEFPENGELVIQGGRHPVIERLSEEGQSGKFVPNDLYMNGSTDLILIVTGPNMGGKSTYLRQAALIALMAQMGSFVPAGAPSFPFLTVSSPASAPRITWRGGARRLWWR
jgi:DNA mismatch repair protein MutS